MHPILHDDMNNKLFTKPVRELWLDYKSEVVFSLVSVSMVVLSTWLGQFIPDEVYDNILTPVFNTCTVVASFGGAWMLFKHSDGMRARLFFAWALVVWGISDLIYLIGWAVAPHQVMDMAAHELTTYELLLGNLLGWVLLLYPTEALRPGWMNWKRAFVQFMPVLIFAALDYVLPINLWPVIALYPYILLVFLFGHMQAYIKWCEDNFSRLDDIDVRWIIRYSGMLFIVGLNYVWMCSTHYHTRGFTQQWFVVLMFVYATEQILFRKDPWSNLSVSESEHPADEIIPLSGEETQTSDEHDVVLDELAFQKERILFEQWMEREKPYTNPDFQLIDIRHVLPTNRTYLSHFLKSTYHCSFYNLVNRYRVEEAMRLMREHPDMKMTEVAYACGFSSPAVFSRTFTRLEGISPRDRATETAGKKG